MPASGAVDEEFCGVSTSGKALSGRTFTGMKDGLPMKRILIRNWRGLVSLALLVSAVAASAVTFFADNFDTDSSALYTVSQDTDTLAVFAYNYSAMGIPAAPGSVGGTTRGLRLEANNGDATGLAAAISLSPTGLSVSGDYALRFDMWLNTNGPFPDGGTGSTQFVTAGVGTAGNTIHKNNSGDGTWTAVDSEGNSSVDYRFFLSGTLQTPPTGVYIAGNTADSNSSVNPYYASFFPGEAPPQLQQETYPGQQIGNVKDGSVGFKWRSVEITKLGTEVTWSIDGLKIATTLNGLIAGDNIFIGYWDPFASISDNPLVTFGLIDNLRVETIPEPGTAGLALLGAATLLQTRRRK
jgi:hypothetical protein